MPLEIVLPLALVVAILIIVLWYLRNKNKIIYKKIVFEKKRFDRYQKGIQNLREHPKKPKEDFNILNKYIRSFFKEYLNLNQNLTYLELAKRFGNQNKKDYARLSNLMSNIKHKGQKNHKSIKQAADIFNKIIETY